MTRVLIVDDKEENLYYLQALLTAPDYTVETAHDGAEALERATANPPDLVVSDLLMPVMDGFTLLRHWKAEPRLKEVPFVVYTATYTEPANEQLALGLGADAFILKPSEPEDFLSRLRQVQATAAAAPAGARTPPDAEKELLKLYSETLIRKLEDKTVELQQVNRALELDIAQRKQTEETLLQSQALLAMASRVGRLGAWALEMPSLALSWSDEVRAIHEMPPDYVPSVEAGIAFYAPEDQGRIREAITGCMRDGQPFDVELQIITASDRRLWTRAIGEARRSADGTITRVQGAFQDIGDRKAAEQEQARTNRALGMLSKCNEALIRAEEETELLHQVCRIAVDNGGYRMAWVGYAQSDAYRTVSPQAHAGVHAGYLSAAPKSWDENNPLGHGPAGRVIRNGAPVVCEDFAADPTFAPWQTAARESGYRGGIFLPLHHAERTFGLLALYSAQVSPTGEKEMILLQELAADLAFGISNLRARVDQRRMEAAVLQVAAGVSGATGTEFFEELARSMAEALGAQASCVAELLATEPPLARTIAFVVEGQVLEHLEYPLRGTPCENLLSASTYVVARGAAALFPQAAALQQIEAQGYVGRRLTNSAGEVIGLLCVIFREPVERLDFVASTLQIFAARAASELERQQIDGRLREQAMLLDVAHEAILVRDLEDRIIYWNKGAERTYGWSAAEALGCKSAELLNSEPGGFQEAIAVLLAKGEWQGELVKWTKYGRQMTVEARWTLVRDADGQPKSILSINNDITDRKRMEAQFFRAQRLESVGTLASGLAHDLNNVLAPILMCSSMLRLGLSPQKMETLIATIESSATRGSQIISKVLTFGRGVDGDRVPIDLREVVGEIVQIATGTFPKNIRTEHHIAEDLAEIIGDPTQWHQVLLNLAVNARDAMPDGGVFRITAENLWVDEHYASMLAGLKSGPHIVVEVSDTGSGIPPDIADHIFDPFFTTKMVGKGTGLGLSTVLGIVKSHGATITLRSQLGSGTTFSLTIPAAGAHVETEAARAQTPLLPGEGQLILVVDDEENVRNAASTVLELHGYRTLLAADGTQAVALYAQHAGAISAVITDITMPYLDGVALVRALQRMQPNLAIIASSGQIDSRRVAELKAMGLDLILKKPYSAELLLRTVEAALSASRGNPVPAPRENPS